MKVLLPFANHKELIMPETREILTKAGFEIVCNDTGKAYSAEKLKEIMSDMDAVFAGGDQYTREVLENAKKLKILARFGVGMENVDLQACKECHSWLFLFWLECRLLTKTCMKRLI